MVSWLLSPDQEPDVWSPPFCLHVFLHWATRLSHTAVYLKMVWTSH